MTQPRHDQESEAGRRTSVWIPARIEQMIEHLQRDLGFRSRSSVITEAVRRMYDDEH